MKRVAVKLPYLLLLVVVLAGCGVSATDRPVDEGEPAGGRPGPVGADPKEPPGPNEAVQADELVANFFRAAAGGGAEANNRVKEYLAGTALETWTDPTNVENPLLSVVRIVVGPTTTVVVDDRREVTLDYQPVGVLNDRGRVDDLPSPDTRRLTFSVVPDERLNFRISDIQGWPVGQLLLSSQALAEYYQLQPIYFWDRDYTALVPDLRYVPLTINHDQRARLRLTWLAAEPSPWLSGAVQPLPAGTTSELVPNEDGTLQVRMSSTAAGGDENAAKRLLFQLRWSLSDGDTTPQIDLHIDGLSIPVEFTEADFRKSLHTWSYRREPGRFDITDNAVRAIPPATLPQALAGPENFNVVAAAISGDPTVAAVVREEFGQRTLHVVHNGSWRRIDALPPDASLGHPSFVPGTGVLLIPTGGPDGRLMAVAADSGAVTEASGNRTVGVSAVAVSPDGRRVAIIADDEVHVAPLILEANGAVTLGSTTRQPLAGQLTATAVAWTSESLLLVAGTRGDNDEPTLWQVTADGVLADDLSGDLVGRRVDRLVCWPTWANTRAEILAVTDLGVYQYTSQFSPKDDLTAPFFG